jgi:hypothetical protein
MLFFHCALVEREFEHNATIAAIVFQRLFIYCLFNDAVIAQIM